MDFIEQVTTLASELVAIDTRGSQSNIDAADVCVKALKGFDVEPIDFVDEHGVKKRVVAARRGSGPCLALCGHMDTVPDDGWDTAPWTPVVCDGVLHGLGSADMKGPIASLLVAAQSVPADIPVMVLLTTDEETTKAGAYALIERSQMIRESDIRGIVIGEPTGMAPVRGHRASVHFTAVSTGIQAHSASGCGCNANWALLDFLDGMRGLREELHSDSTLQDADYEPAVSDFNLVIENPPTLLSVTVPSATARIKYRYSAGINAGRVADAVRESAKRAKVTLTEEWDGKPLDLPQGHKLVASSWGPAISRSLIGAGNRFGSTSSRAPYRSMFDSPRRQVADEYRGHC